MKKSVNERKKTPAASLRLSEAKMLGAGPGARWSPGTRCGYIHRYMKNIHVYAYIHHVYIYIYVYMLTVYQSPGDRRVFWGEGAYNIFQTE